MFTFLLFGVLLVAKAATIQPPTAKDVGFEYSINLDAQNFDFVTIQTTDVVYSYDSVSESIIILDQKGVKNDLQSEGLLNLKYPSLKSRFNYNLTTAYIFTTDGTYQDTGNVIQLKYPLLC